MRKITKYEEFLTESKLQLLLEAKIRFSNEFVDLLNHIDSPLVGKLLELDSKEVNINRNYMTYDIEKEDSVLFYPDDKAEKQGYRITGAAFCHTDLAHTAGTLLEYSVTIPDNNQKVDIKVLTPEQLTKLGTSENDLVVITFKTEYGIKQNIYPMSQLVRDVSELKPSDIKVGRFINNFFKAANLKITEVELNDFINKFKAEMKELKDKFERFEIVKGTDIRHWYYEANYEQEDKGTMGSSCMRHRKCQNFFDIYIDNETVSLIILKSKNDENKIIGRALLWDAELVNRPDPTENADIKFMDRIYTLDYSDETFFKKFARENGFYWKREQDTSDGPLVFNGIELDQKESLINVTVNSEEYDYYPYMDTLKYYNPYEGILSNSDNDYEYLLNEVEGGNGSCRECGGRGTVECRVCEGEGDVTCDNCHNGSNDCRDCDGRGNIDCYTCDGEGELECEECDGEGEVDCGECNGSGEDGDDECSYCSGSGKEDCKECDNGKKECYNCNGECSTECEECSGSGDISCEDCWGQGEYECSRCEGRGEHGCDECNAD